MAIKMIEETHGACWNDRKRKYIADTDADLENLPACAYTGSTAVSLESGRVMVVNTQGKWVEFGG